MFEVNCDCRSDGSFDSEAFLQNASSGVFTVHASLNTSWQVRTEYEHRVHYNEDLSSELLV